MLEILIQQLEQLKKAFEISAKGSPTKAEKATQALGEVEKALELLNYESAEPEPTLAQIIRHLKKVSALFPNFKLNKDFTIEQLCFQLAYASTARNPIIEELNARKQEVYAKRAADAAARQNQFGYDLSSLTHYEERPALNSYDLIKQILRNKEDGRLAIDEKAKPVVAAPQQPQPPTPRMKEPLRTVSHNQISPLTPDKQKGYADAIAKARARQAKAQDAAANPQIRVALPKSLQH